MFCFQESHVRPGHPFGGAESLAASGFPLKQKPLGVPQASWAAELLAPEICLI